MRYICVKNWSKYQHYRDRNPPWIKLHKELLTSETWVNGDDASRALAVAIMLLAAATDNRIKADPAYIQRVAYLNSTPNLQPLIDSDFIEIIDEMNSASTLLADARPERETEERRDREEGEQITLPLAGKKEETGAVPRRKPAVPYPDDFALTEELAAYSRKHLPADRPQAIFEKFTTYHKREDSRFRDWPRAFQNWVQNEVGFRGNR